MAEIVYAIFLFFKKLKFTLVKRFLVKAVSKETSLPFRVLPFIKIRVMKIAVNKEVAIPMIKVVAKPLMGPVPNTNRIKAVKPVVIFASKMEDRALLNPSEMDF